MAELQSGLLLAQVPSWLLFIERPQSQPSTRQLCQAHRWRIWDEWPPSHYHIRAVCLAYVACCLRSPDACVIVGVKPQGGHSECGGVRGAGWQFAAGWFLGVWQTGALHSTTLTRERGGSGRGVQRLR